MQAGMCSNFWGQVNLAVHRCCAETWTVCVWIYLASDCAVLIKDKISPTPNLRFTGQI